MEIEQVRIDKRGEEILYDDQQTDPRYQTVAPKHQRMKPLHRVHYRNRESAGRVDQETESRDCRAGLRIILETVKRESRGKKRRR